MKDLTKNIANLLSILGPLITIWLWEYTFYITETTSEDWYAVPLFFTFVLVLSATAIKSFDTLAKVYKLNI